MKPAALLCIALLLAGCSSAPVRNQALESARATFSSIGASADLSPGARDEYRSAEAALRTADQAFARNEDSWLVTQLADIARKRALLVNERNSLDRLTRRAEAAGAERDRALGALETRRAPAAIVAEPRAPTIEHLLAPLPQPEGSNDQPLTDAERQAIAEAARRAAAEERAARERRDVAKKPATRQAAKRPADEQRRAGAAAPSQPAPTAPAPTVASDTARERASSASEPKPVAAAAPAAQIPAPPAVSLGDDYFTAGTPYLRPGATRTLDPVADAVRAQPGRSVNIHWSAGGAAGELAQRRAGEVRAALLRRGIAPDRIRISASAAHGEGRTARVDVRVAGGQGGAPATR